MICKYFISAHLLSLHSTNKSFAKQKLVLMKPNLAVFFFIYFGSCFWYLKQTQTASWPMPDSSCLGSCSFISYEFPNLTSRCHYVQSSFSWHCLNLCHISCLGHCSIFTDAFACRAASWSVPTVVTLFPEPRNFSIP